MSEENDVNEAAAPPAMPPATPPQAPPVEPAPQGAFGASLKRNNSKIKADRAEAGRKQKQKDIADIIITTNCPPETQHEEVAMCMADKILTYMEQAR